MGNYINLNKLSIVVKIATPQTSYFRPNRMMYLILTGSLTKRKYAYSFVETSQILNHMDNRFHVPTILYERDVYQTKTFNI